MIYGDGGFEREGDHEEHIWRWLRGTADMGLASVELNIRCYTVWQEVLENSLRSMRNIIGLIPVSGLFICCVPLLWHVSISWIPSGSLIPTALYPGGGMQHLRIGRTSASELVPYARRELEVQFQSCHWNRSHQLLCMTEQPAAFIRVGTLKIIL